MITINVIICQGYQASFGIVADIQSHTHALNCIIYAVMKNVLLFMVNFGDIKVNINLAHQYIIR